MKKILFLCLLVCFCVTSVAGAEVKSGVDSFGETKWTVVYNILKSTSKGEPLKDIEFRRSSLMDGTSKYTFELRIFAPDKEDRLSSQDVDVKIDGEIFKAKILSVKSYKYIWSNSGAMAELTPEMLEKIKSAKKITFRFYRIGWEETFELPDNILTEWKQVIVTEK